MSENQSVTESSPSTSPNTAPPPKSKGRTIGMIVGGLVVVALIVQNLALLSKVGASNPKEGDADSADAAHGEGEGEVEPGTAQAILDLDGFLVNLADREQHRYAKVRILLGFEDEKTKLKIEESPVMLASTRQTIIEVMGSKFADEASSIDGRIALRAELLEKLNEIDYPTAVTHVFITELLVQF